MAIIITRFGTQSYLEALNRISLFNYAAMRVAHEYGESVAPVMLKNMDEKRDLFQSDGIHPKPDAQPIIMDNIWPTLKSML